MIDKRFMITFIAVFIFSTFCSFFIWRLFLVERRIDLLGYKQTKYDASCSYAEIDLVIPVNAFLRRCANSANVSMVRRLFVNQWISSNQEGLIKLVVYAQGAMTFDEMKKALVAGIAKEGESPAASFINFTLKTIEESEKLTGHVNKSLKEGYDQKIHVLRGELMNMQADGIEYRRLKNDYRKQLDLWIDQKHGMLLDEIIAKF